MANLETLYSQGDIGSIPGVIGPERGDRPLEPVRTTGKIKKLPFPAKKFKDGPVQTEGYDISGYFWIYAIITVIAAIIFHLFATDGIREGVLQSLDKSPLSFTVGLFWLGWLISLIVIIWAAYKGHVNTYSGFTRALLIITFLLELVMAIIWVGVFFGVRNLNGALFVLFLLILLTIWWIWLLWPSSPEAASGLILYLAWLIYLAWATSDLARRN